MAADDAAAPTDSSAAHSSFCPPETATALEADRYRTTTLADFVDTMDAWTALAAQQGTVTAGKKKSKKKKGAVVVPQPAEAGHEGAEAGSGGGGGGWPELLISREPPGRISRGFLRGVEGIPTVTHCAVQDKQTNRKYKQSTPRQE